MNNLKRKKQFNEGLATTTQMILTKIEVQKKRQEKHRLAGKLSRKRKEIETFETP